MVLTALAPPRGPGAQVRYVRLVPGMVRRPKQFPLAAWQSSGSPQWATSGKIHYHNDVCRAEKGVTLPYILGGHCVRRPTGEVLKDYQDAGYLQDMTLEQLVELYKIEGIQTGPGEKGQIGKHVLEGGDSLVGPLPGTVGFSRLFGRVHPPYTPKSEPVRLLAAKIAASKAQLVQGGAGTVGDASGAPSATE